MSTCKTICVTNRKLVEGDFCVQIERVLQLGVDGVILREKDLSESAYRELAERIKPLCERYQTPFYLHTYTETAKQMGVKKIHLPYHYFLDMTVEEKKKFQTIGVSIHAVEEAVRAQEEGASYLIAGHIFATDCKKGAAPRGTDFLEAVCKSVHIPVYAIGGITPQNREDCLKAGAEGVCLMSSLMKSTKKTEI